MERIVFEIDDNTARKWKYASAAAKRRISQKFDLLLQVMLDKQEDDFWQFLESARLGAVQKGFNDEILNDILNDD